MKLRPLSVALITFAMQSPFAAASCGSAFCTLNTNWSTQGVWTEPGARVDLRYEYVDQNQVRSGTGTASSVEIAEQHHREIGTVNNNLQATFDYAFSDKFGVSVNVPVVDREHKHLHVSHDDASDTELEQWDFKRLGDVRVTGRLQLSDSAELATAYGILVGAKLPTGKFTIANGDGERAERSLQPGSGTTDLLFGGYYRQALPSLRSVWFAQALAQAPLNSRSDFKPGQQYGLDLGYRVQVNDHVGLNVQLNYLIKQRDKGDAAEPEDSGSRTLSLSPGASFALGHDTQLYGFWHRRLYQYVNGVQLSAQSSFVAGISTRF